MLACRALRQNKEAAALGLLEGHAQQGSRDKDIEVLYPASLLFFAKHLPCGMTKGSSCSVFVYAS